jgi:hypothetical protein
MKKPSNSKKSPAKKSDKANDSGELRKPTKLKPLKEKEKKNWKNNLDDEEEDFDMDEDVKFENDFDAEDDEDAEFFDDESF